MNTIGKRVLYLRKKNNLTQKQLADCTGLQRGNISHYEKDKIKPAAEAIIALAGYFNVSTDWLLTGEKKFGETGLLTRLSGAEKGEVEKFVEFLLWRREKIGAQSGFCVAEDEEIFGAGEETPRR